jgi:hypothetical protein
MNDNTAAELSDVQKLRIEQHINDYLQKWQARAISILAILLAVLALFSGLVLFAVQTSGKSAGEEAAKRAVDEQISGQRAAIDDSVKHIREVDKEASTTLGKTQEILGQIQGFQSHASDLEARNQRAAEALAKAQAFLSKEYGEIAAELIKSPQLKDAVVAAANAQLVDLRESFDNRDQLAWMWRTGNNNISEDGPAPIEFNFAPTIGTDKEIVDAVALVSHTNLSFGNTSHKVSHLFAAANVTGIKGSSVFVKYRAVLRDDVPNRAAGGVEIVVIARYRKRPSAARGK